MPSRTYPEEENRPWRMFFIDSENGFESLVVGFERLCPTDAIIIFHRNTLSKKATRQLELGPAPVEWIECVDPGVKNSMDVQIIAELGVRLAQDAFCEAYVISRDKGYAPAIHHLERQPIAKGHDLGVADSIDRAIQQSATKALLSIETFESREDLVRIFTLLFGPIQAESLIERLSAILSADHNPVSSASERKASDQSNGALGMLQSGGPLERRTPWTMALACESPLSRTARTS